MRPFADQILQRQLPAQNPAALWTPTLHARRWNLGFPALYASLLLDVALAERIKRTLARPAQLLAGVATASIARVVDVGLVEVQEALGVSIDALTTADYTLTQQLGTALFQAGVTGLLVPAALAETARRYPSFRFIRHGHSEVRPTPASGTNLVLFTSNLRRGDAYPETDRFACEVTGIPA